MTTDTMTGVDRDHAQFRAELVDSGLLTSTSVPGLYWRSATFETVVRGIETAVSSMVPSGYSSKQFFPALMPREDFIRTDYLRSFPDLTGSIDVFIGNDVDHARLLRLADDGEDWTSALVPAEVILGSAACHPLYASLTGPAPAEGRRFELVGNCFRHEPSLDPCRMQSFRQHELVYIGTPEGAVEHRDTWLERGAEFLRGLGLPVEKVLANDPFFGRAGRMLAANQMHTELKFELVCAVSSDEKPTAITSSNYHLDHFGLPFGITLPDGSPAHTACIGFGLERITLAIVKNHGTDPATWPTAVRDRLSI